MLRRNYKMIILSLIGVIAYMQKDYLIELFNSFSKKTESENTDTSDDAFTPNVENDDFSNDIA